MATLDERAAEIMARREAGPAVEKPSLDERAAAIAAKRASGGGGLGGAPAPVDPNALSSKLGGAVDRMQANLGGTVEAFGEAGGSEFLQSYGKQLRDENLAEAAKYGKPDQGLSVYDVDWGNFGSIAQYVEDLGIETAPSMAGITAGALAGQKVGSIAGAPGRAVGGLVGGFFSSLGINVGAVQNAIKEHDPDAVSPWHAIGSGAGMAALDAGALSVLLKPITRTLGPDAVMAGLLKQNVPAEVATGLVKGAMMEGAVGAAQGAIGNVGATKGANKSFDQDHFVEEVINGLVGGAMMGGVVGGAAHGIGAVNNNNMTEGSAVEQAGPSTDTDRQGVLGKVWSTMGGKSTDMLEGLANASPTARKLVEKFTPDMSGRTASAKTLFEDADMMAGKWRQNLEEVTSGKSEKELLELTDRISRPKAELEEGDLKVREMLDEVYHEAKARGLDDIGYVEGHLPTRLDPEQIAGRREEFIQDIMASDAKATPESAAKQIDNWIEKTSRDDAEAAPVVDRLITENTTTQELEAMASARKDKDDPENLKYRLGQGHTTPEFGHLEKSRSFPNVPQHVLNKYTKEQTGKQRVEAIKDYFEGAAHRLAAVEDFGAKGEKVNFQIAKAVKEAQSQGRAVPKLEIDRMYDLYDAYYGLHGRVKDARIRQAQSTLGAIMTVKTLPLAALSSISEFVTPAIRGDVAAAMASLAPTFNAIAHDFKRTLLKGVPRTEFAQVASEANITFDAATSVAAERLGANMLSRNMSKMTRNFFILNGLSLVTHVNRVYAAKTADHIIARNYQALAAGLPIDSAKGRYYQNQLRSIGINLNTNADAVALHSPSTPSQVKAAWDARVLGVRRFVDQTVLEPNLGSTPLWMNEGRYQSLAMLKRYPAAFGNTMLPALRRKFSAQYSGSNSRAAAGFMGSVFTVGLVIGIGYIQDTLKQIAKTGEMDSDDQRSEEQRFMDVINQTLSPLQLSLFMDFFSAPRYGSDPVSAVAGPMAGFGKDTGMAAYKTIQSFADEPTAGYAVQYLWQQTPARFFKPVKEAIDGELGLNP
ncbi:particle protein [Pseudomonas phage SCYZ1]|nr:particle protein [Pseudomonas phage SCYZ1]